MTSVRQIHAESNPSGKYAYEIKPGAYSKKKKRGRKQITIMRTLLHTHTSLAPSCGAKRMALLFVSADLEAAENKSRHRLRRHQRMQVEQHRREMNVASNLAGLINKNNPAHSQNIPPYGRTCTSAGSSIPLLPLVWCWFTLSCPAEFAPGGLRHTGRLVADLSEQIYSAESTSSSSSAAAAAGLATSLELCPSDGNYPIRPFLSICNFNLFFSTVSCEGCAIICHGFCRSLRSFFFLSLCCA